MSNNLLRVRQKIVDTIVYASYNRNIRGRSMLKINIVAVGSIKEKFFTDAINEYKKRLSRFCKFNIIEVEERAQEKSVETKIKLESQALINALKGYVVLLDREGKEISSEGLSALLNDCATQNYSEISFIIGGSNGVSDELKKLANKSISFGKVTYPHQLFRVVLTEQIYRALTILNNMPYHK